jgi:hypothetical protein
LFHNIKRAALVVALTPVTGVALAGAASATDPTTVGEAVGSGLSSAQTGALAVGLAATVTGLALFAAPEAVRFGKKMYAKARG